MPKTYYVCPDCGFKQRSKAKKRIECHRCGRTYQRSKAKKDTKKKENSKGFFNFKKRE